MGHALYVLPLLLAVAYTIWAWWLIEVEDVPRAEHG